MSPPKQSFIASEVRDSRLCENAWIIIEISPEHPVHSREGGKLSVESVPVPIRTEIFSVKKKQSPLNLLYRAAISFDSAASKA